MKSHFLHKNFLGNFKKQLGYFYSNISSLQYYYNDSTLAFLFQMRARHQWQSQDFRKSDETGLKLGSEPVSGWWNFLSEEFFNSSFSSGDAAAAVYTATFEVIWNYF